MHLLTSPRLSIFLLKITARARWVETSEPSFFFTEEQETPQTLK